MLAVLGFGLYFTDYEKLQISQSISFIFLIIYILVSNTLISRSIVGVRDSKIKRNSIIFGFMALVFVIIVFGVISLIGSSRHNNLYSEYDESWYKSSSVSQDQKDLAFTNMQQYFSENEDEFYIVTNEAEVNYRIYRKYLKETLTSEYVYQPKNSNTTNNRTTYIVNESQSKKENEKYNGCKNSESTSSYTSSCKEINTKNGLASCYWDECKLYDNNHFITIKIKGSRTQNEKEILSYYIEIFNSLSVKPTSEIKLKLPK